jgi:hypothetical protein
MSDTISEKISTKSFDNLNLNFDSHKLLSEYAQSTKFPDSLQSMPVRIYDGEDAAAVARNNFSELSKLILPPQFGVDTQSINKKLISHTEDQLNRLLRPQDRSAWVDEFNRESNRASRTPGIFRLEAVRDQDNKIHITVERDERSFKSNLESSGLKSSKKQPTNYLQPAEAALRLANDLKIEYQHQENNQLNLVKIDEANFETDLKRVNPVHSKEVAERSATLVHEQNYPEFERMGLELLRRIDPKNH